VPFPISSLGARVELASPPTPSTGSGQALAKNARMGHSQWERCTQRSLEAGHPSHISSVRRDADKLQRSLRLRSGQALRVVVPAAQGLAGLRMTNLMGDPGTDGTFPGFLDWELGTVPPVPGFPKVLSSAHCKTRVLRSNKGDIQ
jgi:hypothetical protein